ncbi:MAG: hypothetical protein H0U53_04475 [Actinobacteria bacterium]|nr:hypothetical protein [Actinomycetota bacterium]
MSVVSAFCTMCDRSVYLEAEKELSCPVCSSPLIPTDLDEDRTQRIVENEVMFRGVNERINGVHASHKEDERRIGFVCECGIAGCSEQILLSPAEYEEVRSHALRFVTKPKHNVAGVEIVIAEHPEWIVVEKQGVSVHAAREADPRPN